MPQLHRSLAVQHSFVPQFQVLVKDHAQAGMGTALVQEVRLLCLPHRLGVFVHSLPNLLLMWVCAKASQHFISLDPSLHM